MRVRPLATLLLVPVAVASLGAQAMGIREVTASSRSVIPLNTKIRYTTMILLPDDEEILDVVCGDKDFWVISATQNIAHVKPAKEGAATNLNLVTASGTVYSFLLTEGKTAQPDLKLYVTPDPSAAARGKPKYYSATRARSTMNVFVGEPRPNRVALGSAAASSQPANCSSVTVLRSVLRQRIQDEISRPLPDYLPAASGWQSAILSWGGKWAAYDELYFSALDLESAATWKYVLADRLAKQGKLPAACELYKSGLAGISKSGQVLSESIAVWEQGATTVTTSLLGVENTSCQLVNIIGFHAGTLGDVACSSFYYALKARAEDTPLDAYGLSEDILISVGSEVLFHQVKIDDLGGKTLGDFVEKNVAKKVGYWPTYRYLGQIADNPATKRALTTAVRAVAKTAPEWLVAQWADQIVTGLQESTGRDQDTGGLSTVAPAGPLAIDATPDSGAVEVNPSTNRVSLTFDRRIVARSASATIELPTSTVHLIGGTIAGASISWVLPVALVQGGSYTVHVPAGSVQDLSSGDGNTPFQWTFATSRPSISSADRVTIENTGGVGLSLRQLPGLANQTVAVLREDSAALILGSPVSQDGYKWWPLGAGGKTGWAATADWLVASDNLGLRVGGSAAVANTDGSGLRLRVGPTSSAQTITTLPINTVVAVVGGPFYQNGFTWWQAKVGGRVGYLATGPWLISVGAEPPDTTAPALTVTSHTSGQTVTTSSITLRGTASDASRGNNGATVTVNGQAVTGGTVSGSGAASWSWTGTLTAGASTLKVVAVDSSPAHNATTTALTITYQPPDTTAPALAVTSHTSGQTVTTSSITLRGTASDASRGNSGATVTVNGQAVTGGTTSGSGTANWSWTGTLAAGANTLKVVAVDGSPARNAVTTALTITYQPPDTTAPASTVTSHTSGQTVTTSSITLRGTASDAGRGNNGATVTVNGQAVTGGATSGSGTASWSWTGTLTAGANTLKVVAVDNSQAHNATTTALTITYQPPDTTAPTLAIVSHTNGQTVTTSSITLRGTASDASRGNNGATVTVNGQAVTGGTVGGSGTANWSWTAPLTTGANTLRVVAVDGSPARNAVTTALTITYQPPDTTPPALGVTSHTSGQTVTTSSITLRGTASDAGRGNNGVTVTVNGQAVTGGTVSGSGTASWSWTGALTTGANTVRVVAVDNSPTRNAVTTALTITYQPPDTTAPALAVTSHTSGQTVTTSSITLRGTASDASRGNSGATVTVNGQAVTGGAASGSGTANWSWTGTLSRGVTQFTIIATDGARNQTALRLTIARP